MQFVLFPCRRCGALSVAARSQKTKQCPSCNHSNKLAKVVVIKRFDDKATAMDALRLFKIPRLDREGVPYVGKSAIIDDKRTIAEEINKLFWNIKQTHPEGIAEVELLALAEKEGLDPAKVSKIVKKCKHDGILLETGKQTLKFV
ncbi:MAG: hypothetical protein Q6373_004005 [Candidatus Sigynarchaeota archaeon]